MDVVLLTHVEALGSEGSVIQVRPGFARNYLIPRGLAAAASPECLKALEEGRRQRQRQSERAKADAGTLKRKLEALSLTLKLTLGEEEQVFGSVTVHDVSAALQQEGLEVEKQAILLERPIKALGIYEVPVQLHPEVTATLKVWVVKS